MMKVVPTCVAALFSFFVLSVNAADLFKTGGKAANEPFDCMLPDGSYKGLADANVNKEWNGSLDDAKKKCLQSKECNMLHDYNADNGSWRVCKAVKYDKNGKAFTMTKLKPGQGGKCVGLKINKDAGCQNGQGVYYDETQTRTRRQVCRPQNQKTQAVSKR